MAANELRAIAQSIVADHKGVLAADESTGTIKKRFDSIGVESTEDNRRAYRNLLFTTPGFEEYVGGVIMYDETIRQASDDGTPFAELLASKGVVPGIKVDTGAQDLAGHPGEKVTEGLDGLRARFAEYHALGARFSKWRAVITIGEGIPTDACVHTNAHALARYAALSQEAGIVPIVEPEVLMDAENTIERCFEVTARTLHVVFYELYRQEVALEGMLLKPNMVISGKQCPTQAPSSAIAELTVDCFLRHVPAMVPGIVFLSGGQSEVEATENLNAINRVGGPWPLSFSYGRALQASALQAWGGEPDNVDAGQDAFLHRARMNALAVAGDWSAEVEQAVPA
ncbi:class I fructose-bisphosphate aldolase [Gaiella sp.]|jgi:fructose-bisphosphate aldolase, class I|uniref:class I fructose-bisphosphate aldolase n=1 Tax=Gaiella sp. TaxID=2663207 RepID=UPI002C84EF4A|nr:class I fructose-bisphosphate aldolase [Gaiella sp.]HWO79784.1 class I fructose-bisphosphate aldolase [Gaiella sp.]